MICPGCHLDTPADRRYCEFCGIELDLDFERVSDSLQSEVELKRQRDLELTVRGWLQLAIVFLMLTLAAYVLVPDPPDLAGETVGPRVLVPPGEARPAPPWQIEEATYPLEPEARPQNGEGDG